MKWEEYYNKYDMWQDGAQYGRLASITDFGPNTSPANEIVDCVQYVEERTGKRILKLALASGVRFTGSQVAEIVEYAIQDTMVLEALINASDCLSYAGKDIVSILDSILDEKPALQLLESISQNKNTFTDRELLEIIERLYDNRIIRKLLLNNTSKFSEDTLNQLCDMGVDDEIIRVISERSNIPYFNPDDKWEWNLEQMDSVGVRVENSSEEDLNNSIRSGLKKWFNNRYNKRDKKRGKKKQIGFFTMIAVISCIDSIISNGKNEDSDK